MDLRERVARAICRAEGHSPEFAATFWGERWAVLADAAIAEMRAHAGPTVTRDGPVTAIHDPTLPVDPAGILETLRSWGAQEDPEATEARVDAELFGIGFLVDGRRAAPDRVSIFRAPVAPAPAPTQPRTPNTPKAAEGATGEGGAFLAACEKAGVVIATEADGSRWVSVDELWRLERSGFVVVPRDSRAAVAALRSDVIGDGHISAAEAAEMWKSALDAAAVEGR